MEIRVVFLGTAGAVPTPKRSLPAVLVRQKSELLMFDCGEGAQRQMMIAKSGFQRKMKVFITHMHGDHVLGLPGLLQTMAMLNREKPLDIYGPLGVRSLLDDVRRSIQFVLTFPVQIHEIIQAGIICEEEDYGIEAVWSDHVVPSLAYAFVEKTRPGKFHPEKAEKLGLPEGVLWSTLQKGQNVRLPSGRVVKPSEVMDRSRPGRKIVYTGDTRIFSGLVAFSKGADLLIHDCTLDDELADKAKEDGHSTPSQAAEIAKKAKVKKLVLTHISARYEDVAKLLEQARRVFRNAVVAEDFMEIEVPLRER